MRLDSSVMDRNVQVVLVYKRAFGEAFSAFPLVYLLLRYGLVSRVCIYYENDQILQSIGSYQWHRAAVSHVGIKQYEPNQLRQLVRQIWSFHGPSLLLSCDAGSTQREKLLGLLCPMLRFAYYHHAHSLFAESFQEPEQQQQLARLRSQSQFRYAPGSSMVIWSHKNFAYYQALGFEKSQILTVGSCAYSSEWLQAKASYADELDNDGNVEGRIRILLALRGPNPHYLTASAYKTLLVGLCSIVDAFPGQSFLVRLHPRQSADNDEALSMLLDRPNASLTNLDILEAARGSRAVVSFWSSSIYDALAESTPVIEYYRHEKVHSQTQRDETGRVQSMMRLIGICPSTDNAADVVTWLRSQISGSGLAPKPPLDQAFDVNGQLRGRLEHFVHSACRTHGFFDRMSRRSAGARFASHNLRIKLLSRFAA